MGTIYTPNPNLSAFSQPANPLDSISKLFDNNQTNAANLVAQNLKNAQMQEYQAKVGEEQAKVQQRAEAARQAQTLSDIFAPSLPQPMGADGTPAVPGQSIADKLNDPATQGRINNAVINLSLKAGQPSADIANLLRTVYAQSAVPDAVMARAVVGAGEKLGENDALSIAGQDRIRAGNTANTIKINAAKPNSNTYILPGVTDINGVNGVNTPTTSGHTVYGDLQDSTGPESTVKAAAADIGGFFGKSVNPEVVNARENARLVSSNAINALMANPRHPEGLRKDLEKRFAIEPGTFNAPEVAKQKMIALDNQLADAERKTLADINDPALKLSDRQAAAAHLNDVREVRRQLGVTKNGVIARTNDNKVADPATPANNGGIKFLGFE